MSDMIEADEDVEVSVQNGHYVISKGTIMSKPTILMVNGFQIEKEEEL